MNIIFIRHGKAEDRSPHQLDKDRKLTKKGNQDLQDNIKYLLQYLKDKKVKVVSSPLVRAMETALYLEREVEVQDFLATGNVQELKEYLATQENLDTLILVGHEPFISEWLDDLYQEELIVKKGMLVECEHNKGVLRAVRLKDYKELVK